MRKKKKKRDNAGKILSGKTPIANVNRKEKVRGTKGTLWEIGIFGAKTGRGRSGLRNIKRAPLIDRKEKVKKDKKGVLRKRIFEGKNPLW